MLLLSGCQSVPFTDAELDQLRESERGQVIIKIDSEPTGAIVRVNNIRRGVTPMDLLLDTSNDGVVLSNVDISADYSVNPRVRPGTFTVPVPIAVASYQVGDLVPSRIFFNGLDVQQSGRAVTRPKPQ